MKRSILIILLFAGLNYAADTPELEVVKPNLGTIHRWVTLPGSLEPWQHVDLKARVDGYVKKVNVDVGDRVEAGQVLVEIEVPELEADLIRHLATVSASEIEVKRLREARQKSPHLILPQALDDAEAAYKIATANRDQALTLLEFAQIKAPFAGIITTRLVDPGAFAAKGEGILLALVDNRKIRLHVPVVEMEAGRLRVGQPVEGRIDALQGFVVRGVISRISPSLNLQTRSLAIQADLVNEDGKLLPGMYAKARVAVEQHDNAILLPVQALMKEKTNFFVFKLVEGKAIKTPVSPGFNDGINVEIPGLSAHEHFLIPGTTPLTDGQMVFPGKTSRLEPTQP
jgi:RND family efflux transporter MFP subunit